MNRLAIALTLALTLVLAGTGSADAADPCGPDVKKFCSGVAKGKGRIAQCLDEHQDQLSDACRALRDKSGPSSAKPRSGCQADVAQFCKGIKKGGGRVTKCLDEHADQLSATCREIREKHGLVISKFRSACSEDANKHCAAVEAGEGRVTKCLVQHKAEVSPDCIVQLDDAMERIMAQRGPCALDATKHCTAVQPGEGRLRACLTEHKKDLNLSCGEYLTDPKHKLR
jgi:hypothetical protein